MIIGKQWDQMLLQKDICSELSAFIVIFPLIPYLLFAIIVILGIRSNNIDLILITLILSIGYYILNLVAVNHNVYSYSIIPRIIFFILPINILLFSFIRKKSLKYVFIYFFIILIEVGIFSFLYNLHEFPKSEIVIQFHTEFPKLASSLLLFTQRLSEILLKTSFIENIPVISFFSFIIVVIFFIFIFVTNRDEKKGGYLFITISVFLAACSRVPVPGLMIFFTSSGLILLITTIEASFSMAYIDELTGLHGRRSLNETLSSLTKNYAIAMLDIDHFKKFNDKYGHKTGDQVLKMVAAKLSEVSGGAKMFRYGGEEFTAIFSGKTSSEAEPYMEEYRRKLESTEFVVRSSFRKSSTSKSRGKTTSKNNKTVNITVSIGIAEYSGNQTKPEKVLKAADKILYKAKHNGRNRVEIQKIK